MRIAVKRWMTSLVCVLALSACGDDGGGGDDPVSPTNNGGGTTNNSGSTNNGSGTNNGGGSNNSAACVGKPSCPTAGASCNGDTLVLCAPDADGCLVPTNNACGAAGKVCDAEAGACVTTCEDDAACADLGDGASFCDAGQLTTCSLVDGCLVATATACPEGKSCVDATDGTSASCQDGNNLGTFDPGEAIPTTTGGPLAEGEWEYYTITFTGAVSLSGTLTGTGGDADIEITDEADEVVYAGVATGPDSFSGIFLAAGTYVIGVHAYEELTGYELVLSTRAVGSIGTFAGGETIAPATGTGLMDGQADNYTLSFTEVVVLTGSLGITAGEASFALLDAGGSVLTTADGMIDDILLAPGDYVVRILATADATGYELGLTTRLPTPLGSFGASDTLPTQSEGAHVSGQAEFYAITFTEGLFLGIDLSATSGDPDLGLYDATSAEKLDSWSNEGGVSVGGYWVTAGSYVFEVRGSTALPDYTLALSVSPPLEIGAFTPGNAIGDTQGGPLAQGSSQLYQITFTQPVILSGTLDASDGDPDLELTDTSGADIESWRAVGPESFRDFFLSSGTYFFRITAYSALPDYTLSLSTASPTSLGSFAPAASIPSQSGGPLSEGSSDYYTVEFSADVQLSGTLTATTGDADFFVYSSAGDSLESSTASGDENFSFTLSAGSYVLGVKAFVAGGEVGAYTLSMSTSAP